MHTIMKISDTNQSLRKQINETTKQKIKNIVNKKNAKKT